MNKKYIDFITNTLCIMKFFKYVPLDKIIINDFFVEENSSKLTMSKVSRKKDFFSGLFSRPLKTKNCLSL